MLTYMRKFIGIFILALGVGCAASDDSSTRTRGSASSSNPFGNAAGSGIGSAGSGALARQNGGLIASAGTAALGGSGALSMDPNVCASASVRARRITPTVEFVVDGSGSMNAKFGDTGSRWSVLRDALVGTNGVVPKLESVVKFGMTIYSNSDPMKCPGTTEVKPGLMNFMPISSAYPNMEPGGGTPTGEALQQVVDSLPDYSAMLDSTEAAPIIILATDGEPNGCAAGAACNWAADWAACLGSVLTQVAAAPATYDTTFAAVRKAKDKKIPVWVISLADGLNAIPDLQTTANIGAGLADDAMPGAPIYSPKNTGELTSTLTKLLGDVVVCDVQLSGTLEIARACEGSVKMNGVELPCNGDQGWKPIDDKHIVLQGDACTKFKSDPTVLLEANFPCDVVRPD
jgi:Mg-chelatase subunit ChlD